MYSKEIKSIIIIVLVAVLLVGCSSNEPVPQTFEPPADEATLIRNVLRENGVAIADDQPVGDYLGITSYGNYTIKISHNGHITMVLSDNLTKLQATNQDLNGGFVGLTATSTNMIIDTIKVITDSLVAINQLSINSNSPTVFEASIAKLRTRHLWLICESSVLPIELMQVASPPHKYGALDLYVFISKDSPDALREWVSRHNGDMALPYKN